MTNAIIAKLEAIIQDIKDDFKPEVKAVENDVKAIGAATLSYIETNALQDAYQIALTVVEAAVPGASWGSILTNILALATADGKQIVKGAEAVVAAQAQADLIAAGKIIAPTTVPVTPPAA